MNDKKELIQDNAGGVFEQGKKLIVGLYDSKEIIIDEIISIAPLVGKGIQIYKNITFEKRLREHKSSIEDIYKRIKQLSESSEHYDFFANRVGGKFFGSVLKEEQDEKVKYLTEVFKNIVDDHLLDEESILNIFDLLNSLRMNDIKLLQQLDKGEFYALSELDKEQEAFQFSISNLLRLRVIELDGITYGHLPGEQSVYTSDFKVTKIGERLLTFIRQVE